MTQGEWKDTFGDNLSALLRERGFTQKQLAKDSGVSEGMISDYINKFTAPSVFAAINLAYAMDVDVDDLLDFDEMIES